MQHKENLKHKNTDVIDNKFMPDFNLFIKRNKRKTSKALYLFFNGIKNEASETKEASRIIVKYLVYQKITKSEEKLLKTQVQDVFKILGIGIPFVFIPGATILIPFIVKVAKKKGIDIYPSGFKQKDSSLD